MLCYNRQREKWWKFCSIQRYVFNRWGIIISLCTAKMITWMKTHQFLFFYKNLVAIETVAVCVSLICVRLFAAPWTVARQTPLPMEFSRQEYWSEVPFPTPGGSSWPRNPNRYLQCLLHWQADSLLQCHLVSHCAAKMIIWIKTHQFFFFYRNLVSWNF